MNPENPYQGPILPLPPAPAGSSIPPDTPTPSGNITPSISPYAKPRKRKKLIIAGIILSVVLLGAVSYGGYRLLDSKQAPKSNSTSKPKDRNKSYGTATKPPGATTKPSSTQSTTATTQSPSTKTPSTNAPTQNLCKGYSNSFCYQWVGARQYVAASGVSVQFGQASPKTTGTALDGHTLVELSTGSTDGKQYVEVGWILPDMGGDDHPRLFVYHWVDGKTSCYNGCGFVQVSRTIHPGDPVTPGATGTYAINYSAGQWQVFYNGTEVGYFPGSLWGGRFTQVGFTQIFGEVSSTTQSACTQMGNGIYGSTAGSLLISNYTLLGSSTSPNLMPYNLTNFSASPRGGYDYGGATYNSLRIGGPGSC